jgi:hypothetical protein
VKYFDTAVPTAPKKVSKIKQQDVQQDIKMNSSAVYQGSNNKISQRKDQNVQCCGIT